MAGREMRARGRERIRSTTGGEREGEMPVKRAHIGTVQLKSFETMPRRLLFRNSSGATGQLAVMIMVHRLWWLCIIIIIISLSLLHIL
jgi:hypothetical protein